MSHLCPDLGFRYDFPIRGARALGEMTDLILGRGQEVYNGGGGWGGSRASPETVLRISVNEPPAAKRPHGAHRVFCSGPMVASGVSTETALPVGRPRRVGGHTEPLGATTRMDLLQGGEPGLSSPA